MSLYDYLSVCLCVFTTQKIDQVGGPETFYAGDDKGDMANPSISHDGTRQLPAVQTRQAKFLSDSSSISTTSTSSEAQSNHSNDLQEVRADISGRLVSNINVQNNRHGDDANSKDEVRKYLKHVMNPHLSW